MQTSDEFFECDYFIGWNLALLPLFMLLGLYHSCKR
jgi:hypothetical protein